MGKIFDWIESRPHLAGTIAARSYRPLAEEEEEGGWRRLFSSCSRGLAGLLLLIAVAILWFLLLSV
jgi:hypothetical protein